MHNIKKSRIIAAAIPYIARFTLGTILLTSSCYKMRHPYDFLASIYKYEIVSPQLGLLTAATLPAIELTLAVFLLLGVWTAPALAGSAILFGFFSAMQMSAISRGLSIGCGCGIGGSDQLVSYYTFARALLMALLAIAGIFVQAKDIAIKSRIRAISAMGNTS